MVFSVALDATAENALAERIGHTAAFAVVRASAAAVDAILGLTKGGGTVGCAAGVGVGVAAGAAPCQRSILDTGELLGIPPTTAAVGIYCAGLTGEGVAVAERCLGATAAIVIGVTCLACALVVCVGKVTGRNTADQGLVFSFDRGDTGTVCVAVAVIALAAAAEGGRVTAATAQE